MLFIGSADFESAIRRTGATFVPTEDTWPVQLEACKVAIHDPLEQLFRELKHRFLESTPSRMRTLKTVLERLREKHPEREVIIVQEVMYMGTWPFILGAPLPRGYNRFPEVITFSSIPLDGSAPEHAPSGPGLPPGLGALYRVMAPGLADLTSHANAVWGRLGATRKVAGSVLHTWFTRSTVTALPCSPSLEYPRSCLSPKVRFIGGTLPQGLDPSTRLPAWWGELPANRNSTEVKRWCLLSRARSTSTTTTSSCRRWKRWPAERTS